MKAQWKGRLAGGRFRLLAWLVALAVGGAHAGCGRMGNGEDDRFVLLRRAAMRQPGAPTPLVYPPADDQGAARVRRLMSDGFAGELLRTFAMTRRLVEQSAPPGSVRRVRAGAPAYVALGISDLYREWPYRDRTIGAGWLRDTIAADVPIVWVDDEPSHAALGQTLAVADAPAAGPATRDAVALEQIVTGLGRAIVSLVAPSQPRFAADPAPPYPLRDGYVQFLNVVNAEWRTGSGDGMVAGMIDDARALLRRAEPFAAVRANQGLIRFQAARAPVVAGAGEPTGAEPGVPEGPGRLVRDPVVIASTLYRIAASPAGHRLARDEVYRPFVEVAPPTGISPGRLLGAFRNFQAKLLSAWNATVLAGRPPQDLIDLVEAYADAYPQERAEVTRIFLITTYGLTACPGGVDPRRPPDEVASQLATLTADVLFGVRDLRTALRARGGGAAAPVPAL